MRGDDKSRRLLALIRETTLMVQSLNARVAELNGRDLSAESLRCVECGAESDDTARGWRIYLDVNDEPAVYCPDCAESEFGGTRGGRDAG